MSFKIIKATADDAYDILEYLKKIGGETDNLSFGNEGLPFSVESEALYLKQIESSYDDVMYLAKDNGKLIGCASLNRLPRRMKHRGEISITVLKDYWNKGVGSKLLHLIIDFATENSFDIIDLQVRSDNKPAIHLYKKFGFIKSGTHPAFFKIDGKEISFDYMYLRLS